MHRLPRKELIQHLLFNGEYKLIIPNGQGLFFGSKQQR